MLKRMMKKAIMTTTRRSDSKPPVSVAQTINGKSNIQNPLAKLSVTTCAVMLSLVPLCCNPRVHCQGAAGTVVM